MKGKQKLIYLGEVDVEEERLFSIGNLNAILLLKIIITIIDINVVYSICYLFHFFFLLVFSKSPIYDGGESFVSQKKCCWRYSLFGIRVWVRFEKFEDLSTDVTLCHVWEEGLTIVPRRSLLGPGQRFPAKFLFVLFCFLLFWDYLFSRSYFLPF